MSSKGNGEGSVYYNKQRKKWNAQYKEYDTKTGKMKYFPYIRVKYLV